MTTEPIFASASLRRKITHYIAAYVNEAFARDNEISPETIDDAIDAFEGGVADVLDDETAITSAKKEASMNPTNDQRAMRCDSTIAKYGDADLQTNLVDLLADAMHWCDSCMLDFHIALAQACRHYINELNDQQQDERRLIP